MLAISCWRLDQFHFSIQSECCFQRLKFLVKPSAHRPAQWRIVLQLFFFLSFLLCYPCERKRKIFFLISFFFTSSLVHPFSISCCLENSRMCRMLSVNDAFCIWDHSARKKNQSKSSFRNSKYNFLCVVRSWERNMCENQRKNHAKIIFFREIISMLLLKSISVKRNTTFSLKKRFYIVKK